MGEDSEKGGEKPDEATKSASSYAAPRPRSTSRGSRGRSFALWAVLPVVVFVVLTILILTTGKPSAGELMADASKSLGEVERGVFNFEISVTPRGSETAEASTIKLSGPFEIVPGKPLPEADITYTITAGERSQTVRILTTGDSAYTVLKGQAYELPEESVKQLKSATKQVSEDSGGETTGLSGLKLDFGKWLIDPVVKGGGEYNGTPVWSTTAKVDVVAALQDLAASASALSGVTGSSLPKLSKKEIEQLRDSFSNASVEVLVGRYDDIVRKIDLSMDFNAPEGFSATAGGLTGGKLGVVIGIDKPNEPVTVEAPADPLPFESLQTLGQGSQEGTTLDDGAGK